MTFEHFFQLMAGLGLFMFALRFLALALDGVLSRHLRRWVGRFFQSAQTTVLAGISLTTVFQSSQLALVTTMGLMNNALISLEQATLILLGAGFGSALKSLIFAGDLQGFLGIILIIVGALSRMFVREGKWVAHHYIPVFVGFYFLALDILASHLPLLWNYTAVVNVFAMDATEISGQLIFLFLACVCTIVVRSGSLMAFIIIQLALLEKINFATGGILILGTHLGQAVPGLLRSFSYKKEIWRLTVGQSLMGAISVLITLFFYPYFMSFVDMIIPGKPMGAALGFHLAFVHLFLNLFHLLWWGALLNVMASFLKRLFPSEAIDNTPILSPKVRLMLSHSLPLALKELEKQISQLLHLCKQETDACFQRLYLDPSENLVNARMEMSFELLKEANYELLLSMCRRHDLDPDTQNHTQHFLKRLSHGNHLFQTAQDLKTHLEKGQFNMGFHFPKELYEPIEAFQQTYNQYWLAILLNKQEKGMQLEEVLEDLQDAYFKYIQSQTFLPPSFLSWLYQTMTYLQAMTHQIYWLYTDPES